MARTEKKFSHQLTVRITEKQQLALWLAKEAMGVDTADIVREAVDLWINDRERTSIAKLASKALDDPR